ncbi:MAG: Gfo/Idh/MocA family oxidoreductase [Pirellulales bacterium]|nr:Gfo/Idh/MocA family oxidoreductase [Pirellulales bacterium]
MSVCRLASIASLVLVLTLIHHADAEDASRPLRAGIIGTDTSHAVAFTKALNDPKATGPLAKVDVVAFFQSSSPDIASSRDRVERFTKQLEKMKIKRCGSIDELLGQVDVVLLESMDGRKHVEQVLPVFKSGKPVFIDKPLAGSLADVVRIVRLSKQYNTPWFSSSALRYAADVQKMRANPPGGKVLGCTAFSPCHLEPTHPDLFWYGIHGVEILYTIMGAGCQTVAATKTPGEAVAVGTWKDGRVGTFRGLYNGGRYGALVFGRRGVRFSDRFEGYGPLVVEIAQFFTTGKPPISPEETLEMYTFMEAAHESIRQGGVPVSLAKVLNKAEAATDAAEKKGP